MPPRARAAAGRGQRLSAPGPLHPALTDLAALWREEAERLAQWGAEGTAATLRRAADELEAALRARDDAPLTLQQAAAESGLSPEHIGRLVRAGKLPNAGRPNAPKIRRRDLPRKAGILRSEPAVMNSGGAPRGQIVRAVVNSNIGASDG